MSPTVTPAKRPHPVSYKNPVLPDLDKTAIAAEAKALVLEELRPLTGADRVTKAGQIIAAADETVADVLPELEATCLSYTVNDGYASVYRAAGISSTSYKLRVIEVIADRDAGTPPTYVPNAEELIPILAHEVYLAKRRKVVAMDERNMAMLKLWTSGEMTRDAAAALAGKTGPLLSQIKAKADKGKVAA